LLDPAVIKASVTYRFIQPWGPVVIDNFGKVIPIFKDLFQQLSDFFEKLPGKVQ
jgi:membrane protein required for colicin V production